jgi:2-octaprenyl-6-methoxyphenol hydroxylase
MLQDKSADILVVGGGPVGATLALALHHKGIASTILEARSSGVARNDQRALALSYGSRLILDRLGLWMQLSEQATPINTIHVSQRGSLGRARLRATDYGQPALGYVLSYGALSRALDDALASLQSVRVVYNAEVTNIEPGEESATVSFSDANSGNIRRLSIPLAILADGGNSLAYVSGLQRKIKDYGHSALVAKVCSELPHENVAYERFTPTGPVALLPNGEEFSLVWTGRHKEITALLQMDDETFLDELHQHFGDRVGRFLEIGPRLSFPLRQAYLESVAIPHLAVIGNAAQTMHPVAGQGFNIGLRDAWELATSIAASDPEDWGSKSMLQAYRKARKADTRGGLLFTDFLVNIFSNELVGFPAARSAGLGVLDVLQPIKRRLVQKMSFGR